MKIFVKIFAIVLAMLLLVAFIACKSDDEVKDTDAAVTTTAAADEGDADESVADESGDADDSKDTTPGDTSDTTPPVETFDISLGTDNGEGWEDYNDIK